jgi:hypothetical protein
MEPRARTVTVSYRSEGMTYCTDSFSNLHPGCFVHSLPRRLWLNRRPYNLVLDLVLSYYGILRGKQGWYLTGISLGRRWTERQLLMLYNMSNASSLVHLRGKPPSIHKSHVFYPHLTIEPPSIVQLDLISMLRLYSCCVILHRTGGVTPANGSQRASCLGIFRSVPCTHSMLLH